MRKTTRPKVTGSSLSVIDISQGHVIKKPSLLHTQLGASLKCILKTEPE